jgi:hypothetical protein
VRRAAIRNGRGKMPRPLSSFTYGLVKALSS